MTEGKPTRSKLSLLALAKQLGNVSEACKRMGFSRGSFYRFQELYDRSGEEALERTARRKPLPSNRVHPSIEAAIIDLAHEHPDWGQKRVSNDLKRRGMSVSAAGVRCVWQRHCMETTEKRRQTTAADRAGKGSSVISSGARTDRQIRSIVRILCVFSVALIACLELAGEFQYVLVPSSVGDLGFSIDGRWKVDNVTSGSAADRAGIKVGDVIGRELPLRGREILGGSFSPVSGERLNIDVEKGGKRQDLTLVASPLKLSTVDVVSGAILAVALSIFFVVGMMLVLIRPGKMTWGFYLFSIVATFAGPGDPHIVSPVLTLAYMLVSIGLAMPAGLLGCMVFFLRFPSDSVAGWRKTTEQLATLLFSVVAAGQSLHVLAKVSSMTHPKFTESWGNVWVIAMLSCVAVSVISLAGTYRGSTGLERERIKWVFFGLALASVALLAFPLELLGWLTLSNLAGAIVMTFVVAIPLTVLYAIIRYRVIDVRFIVSRTLILGIAATMVGFILILLDNAFSTRFANSPSKTAVYGGIALLVGLSINVARQRITRLIDAVFFRQWHRTQERAQAVGVSVRGARSKVELYEPLAAGAAKAFSIASAGLFERTSDGGFVRVAAFGWPAGTIWHVLPDDPLARRSDQLRRVSDIDCLQWREPNGPAGVARPSVMIPIAVGKNVAAVLLLGAHPDGTALDPDEIRSVRILCEDAAFVYRREPAMGPDRTLVEQRPVVQVSEQLV